MKLYFKQLLLFITPLLVCAVFLFHTDGFLDPFYLRFTSPKQSSLIIGTSRSAQGLVPSIINQELNRDDIYNFSFTIVHSPYGPIYFKQIKQKLTATEKRGVFILNIDPWSVSVQVDQSNSSIYTEKELALGKTLFINHSPNLTYLLFAYEGPYIDFFRETPKGRVFLHDDGWLEVNAPMDEKNISKRLAEKIKSYEEKVRAYRFSEFRWNYFRKTIEFLKDYGTVYLVRLPVHKSILSIDNKLIPNLNRRVEELADSLNVRYLDLSEESENYIYVDGNHLYKKSSFSASRRIAKWIKNVHVE